MIGSSFNEYFFKLQFELLSFQSDLAFRSTGFSNFPGFTLFLAIDCFVIQAVANCPIGSFFFPGLHFAL